MKVVIRVYWPPKNLSEGLLRGQHGGVRTLSLMDTLISGAVFVKMWVETHCRLEHILHQDCGYVISVSQANEIYT
jgi:hypothetical protein